MTTEGFVTLDECRLKINDHLIASLETLMEWAAERVHEQIYTNCVFV